MRGMANEEIIGFHKGALTTLIKERQELIKMVQVVEQIIQMHMKSLKDLGIDIEQESQKQEKKTKVSKE